MVHPEEHIILTPCFILLYHEFTHGNPEKSEQGAYCDMLHNLILYHVYITGFRHHSDVPRDVATQRRIGED